MRGARNQSTAGAMGVEGDIDAEKTNAGRHWDGEAGWHARPVTRLPALRRKIMIAKRILMSLLVVFLVAAVTTASFADKKEKSHQVGVVTIETKRLSLGVGYTWGEGTLRYKGKDYKFKVKGLNAIGLGFTTMTAEGEVYNMKSLSEFPGTYYGVEGGATLIEESAGLVIKNSKGVMLNLKAKHKGVSLKLGDQGLTISPEWQ